MERIAQDALSAVGADGPICPFELARRLGLRVVFCDLEQSAVLAGNVIGVDHNLRACRQRGLIAHEVAHWLLIDQELPDREPDVGFLGAQLQVPSARLRHDLNEIGVCQRRLAARHRFASYTLLARRVGEVCHGRVSSWRHGQLRWEIGPKSLEIAKRYRWRLTEGYELVIEAPRVPREKPAAQNDTL